MTKIKINLIDGRSMTAELDEQVAPITVANFLKLVDSNFYNGLIFHRVIPGYLISYAQNSPRSLFRVCRQDREWGI